MLRLKCIIIILIAFYNILLISSSFAGSIIKPEIIKKDNNYILVLPEKMKSALKEFDPEFKVRCYSDYMPRYSRIYSFTEKQSMFSVVGDFNGDCVLDVVVDGDNQNTGRRLIIMSNKKSFKVIDLQKIPRISNKEMMYRKDQTLSRKIDDGIDLFLISIAPGRIESGFEPYVVNLQYEAFEVIWDERTSAIIYYDGSSFKHYLTGD